MPEATPPPQKVVSISQEAKDVVAAAQALSKELAELAKKISEANPVKK